MTEQTTELVAVPDATDLTQPPIYDGIDPRQMVLIKSQIAPRATDGEVAHFLQLCGHYGLDPFAREAWCAKSEKGGNLLIMVGRDGLRKIAQRQGIHVDGDVVREKDELQIVRTPDGNRTVAHSYGNPAGRGNVIGAWAECRKGGPRGVPLGYFYAPLEEYKPANASSYSPWSKQVGVMILAAAERQAIRQATPLGGLLATGEDETVNGGSSVMSVAEEESGPIVLHPDVNAVVEEAQRLNVSAFSSRESAYIATHGQEPDVIAQWVRRGRDAVVEADKGEPEPAEAEVVEPAPAESKVAKLERLRALIAEAEDAGDDEAIAELAVEWDATKNGGGDE